MAARHAAVNAMMHATLTAHRGTRSRAMHGHTGRGPVTHHYSTDSLHTAGVLAQDRYKSMAGQFTPENCETRVILNNILPATALKHCYVTELFDLCSWPSTAVQL
jgi:hypothetical protein